MDNNYTRPNDESHVDTPEDWLAGALVFAQALGHLIPEGDGLLIKAVGDAQKYFGRKEDLLIVANLNNQIQVIPLSDITTSFSNFKEGTWVTLKDENPIGLEKIKD